ncbi:AT-rich interactive domain-containing protein 5B [Anabrus simplex]|uniref:AT-rich interactive domain-containing protein 5B n=1 Tax=Anabrus simplex TaxID=316456 RepID=UPI0035A2F538
MQINLAEDEVLAISEKVVLRVVDLLDWITEEAHWGRGLEAIWDQECPGAKCNDAATASAAAMLVDSALDFQDVNKEKHNLDTPDPEKSAVVVLSFPRYCRYRGIMKRLEGVTNKWLHNALVMALGGFAVPGRNTRILFCKETFDYPDLEGHEQLCNHLAPNLKGRPRRKRKKRSLSPGGSESNESESSLSTVSSSVKGKQQQSSQPQAHQSLQQHEQQPSCSKHVTLAPPRRNNSLVQSRKSTRVTVSQEEKDFLAKLHAFMKTRRTPIQRVPHLGFKEIDLYAFYTKVQKLGGYNVVTSNRLWKTIYDELGGHQGSTSAATYTRRHYERLLLPYERSIRAEKPVSRNHMKLKEDKKQGTVRSNNQASTSKPNSLAPAAKSSTMASSSKSSASSSAKSSTPSSAKQTTESKETASADMSKEKTADPESKSSLRSVRAKSDKSQELTSAAPATPGKENIPVSNVTEEKVEIKAEPSSLSVSKQNVSKDKTAPEVIDLAEDSPVKIGKTTVPAVKKRKLDILKEGGLEVTAITSPPAVAERRQSVIQHAAPIQASDSQVSITVTPDVSHILGSPATDLASTPSPSLSYDSPTQQQTVNSGQDYNKAITIYTSPEARSRPSSRSGGWTPPRVVQSSSMYARSETTVYGNPKENIDASRQLQPLGHPKPTALFRDEVLDLRVKCVQKPVVTLSRVTNNTPVQGPSRNTPRTLPKPSNSNTSFPTVGGRTVIGTLGSNLEITVVDVPKTAANSSHRNHQLPQSSHHHLLKHSQMQQKSSSSLSNKLTSNRLPGKNENGKYHYSYNNQPIHRNNTAATNGSNSPLVIPSPYPTSSSNGRSGTRLQQLPSTSVPPFLPGGNSSLFPGYLPPTASGNGAKPPFLPILDPLYYASLYNSHVYPPALSAPGFVPPPMFGPSPEQLQLYKDLMNQHHSNMRFPQQNNSVNNYLGLPRDGSTSITPVNHSANPTPK